MLNNTLNAHGSFTPAAVAPPNAITPEQVIRHHRSKRRGGMGEQALFPPSSYQCSAFHIIVKGILQCLNNSIPDRIGDLLFCTIQR